ncbi:MAG: alternative ribosome rescue aminoacyl-tRNA hydrolase ArfB [Maribacter sp.]
MEKKGLVREIKLKAVRSSGPGGQHVNKVSTKVELTFDVENSNALTLVEKDRIYDKLASRLTKENILILQSDESRSQSKNKEYVTKRFLDIMEFALAVPKKRRKTKPSRSSIEKRLKSKKKDALKKVGRRRPSLD